MKNNNLPEYWCVKNDGSQLFKDTVIKYLNNITNKNSWLNISWYYGFDGSKYTNGTDCWSDIKNFQNNPTLLTLEQFIDLTTENTIETEFILPEKWYIERNKENHEVINKWFNDNYPEDGNYNSNYFYLHSTNIDYYSSYPKLSNKRVDYTEITFEQFKKYVLKENKDIVKEILGYKVKDEFVDFAMKMVNTNLRKEEWLNHKINFLNNTDWKPIFEKAGVLNLWFNVIYKEDQIIPTIGGYKLQILEKENSFRFGCKIFPISLLPSIIYSNLDSVVVDDITISKTQLIEIFDYITNKLKK